MGLTSGVFFRPIVVGFFAGIACIFVHDDVHVKEKNMCSCSLVLEK